MTIRQRLRLLTAGLCTLLLPGLVHAQVADVTLTVLGLNDDVSKALVRFEDRNQGVLLQIREIQTASVKKSWFVENRNDERKRTKRLRRKQFPTKANVNQVDPSGRYTVIGAPDGRRSYDIMVLRDGRVGLVGKIPLKTTDDGNRAKAMLKEVVWAPNGKQLIVIVNQSLEREEGEENVDDLHWFRFRKWKVKWLTPDDGAASQTEATP